MNLISVEMMLERFRQAKTSGEIDDSGKPKKKHVASASVARTTPKPSRIVYDEEVLTLFWSDARKQQAYRIIEESKKDLPDGLFAGEAKQYARDISAAIQDSKKRDRGSIGEYGIILDNRFDVHSREGLMFEDEEYQDDDRTFRKVYFGEAREVRGQQNVVYEAGRLNVSEFEALMKKLLADKNVDAARELDEAFHFCMAKLKEKAQTFAETNYPNYKNPDAYWDIELEKRKGANNSD
jgi:hypothetical protein